MLISQSFSIKVNSNLRGILQQFFFTFLAKCNSQIDIFLIIINLNQFLQALLKLLLSISFLSRSIHQSMEIQ